MPRTPIEVRPVKTRTSVTGKRMHWPPAAVSSTSSCSVQIWTSTIASSSSSFIAMMPERRTSTKSDRLLRPTLPPVGPNLTSPLALAATALRPVGRQRHPLDIAGVRNRDHHFLALDQILVFDLVFLVEDHGFAWGGEL